MDNVPSKFKNCFEYQAIIKSADNNKVVVELKADPH